MSYWISADVEHAIDRPSKGPPESRKRMLGGDSGRARKRTRSTAPVAGVEPGFSLATRTVAEARALYRSLWDLGGGEKMNRGYLVPPVHPRVFALRHERL
jgi:hypothetical protein